MFANYIKRLPTFNVILFHWGHAITLDMILPSVACQSHLADFWGRFGVCSSILTEFSQSLCEGGYFLLMLEIHLLFLQIQDLYLGSGSPIHIVCIGPNPAWMLHWGPFFEDLDFDVDFEVHVGVQLDDLAVPEEVQLVFYIRKIEIKQSWVGATLFEIDFWSC